MLHNFKSRKFQAEECVRKLLLRCIFKDGSFESDDLINLNGEVCYSEKTKVVWKHDKGGLGSDD